MLFWVPGALRGDDPTGQSQNSGQQPLRDNSHGNQCSRNVGWA